MYHKLFYSDKMTISDDDQKELDRLAEIECDDDEMPCGYKCNVDYLCIEIDKLETLLQSKHILSRRSVRILKKMMTESRSHGDTHLLLMDRNSIVAH